jgi:UDP-N-acetylmuramate dehydrogenase
LQNAATQPDTLFSGLAGAWSAREPLGPRTWMNVGGAADLFFAPADVQSLQALLQRAHEQDLPVRVIGGGANLLVDDDGVDGVVISLEHDSFRAARLDRYPAAAGVAAGADLPKLVMETARQGLTGLHVLAGVPGTVGGAVRMNAGGKYGEIGEVVEAVDLLRFDGSALRLTRGDLEFGYRRTSIPSGIIAQVELKLGHDDPGVTHERVKEIMAEKKRNQPLADKSAGCVFKNPLVGGERVSAGKLIDRAGLKGTRVGGASVSERHANFFVTEPGCAARDIIELIERVQRTVVDTHDVRLETELVIWRRGHTLEERGSV